MMREFFVLTCLIVVLEFATSFNVCPHNPLLTDKDVSKNGSDHLSYRLPKEVVPTSYIVHLDKDRTNFTYLGSVQIFVSVVEPTSTVVVHNDGLRIMEEEVNLYPATNDSSVEPILCRYHDAKRQFYIVKFEQTLEPGEYVLRIRFEGEIRDDVFGFYRSFYAENNETKYMDLILKMTEMETFVSRIRIFLDGWRLLNSRRRTRVKRFHAWTSRIWKRFSRWLLTCTRRQWRVTLELNSGPRGIFLYTFFFFFIT